MSTDDNPQIFNPETEQGVSQSLGDLLAREWTMPESLRGKAILVSDLILLFDALQATGWVEHTNDWDWRVTVTMRDGTTYGTQHPESDDYAWADTLFLALADKEARMGPNEVRDNIWHNPPEDLQLIIEEFHDTDPTENPVTQREDEVRMTAVNLADVAMISYGEA